ncbi:FMN-dependent dehydrogenase [Fusarium oxysporum f. sp. phaseoli]
MRTQILTSALLSGAMAARPFLEQPDTGLEIVVGDLPTGKLPKLEQMIGLPDFEWAAKNYLPIENYTYYRNGAAGEWSYRNNLEVFQRYRFKPRTMVDITNLLSHQLYLTSNDTETQELLDRSEKAGAAAIVFTVDSAADGNRHRAARFGVGSADSDYSYITWDYYKKLQKMTKLPVIIKGIGSAADAKLAVQHGAPAIILSNHGGRQLDGSPSGLEVALEIHQEAPEVFKKIEVYADGGVRYGADVLKLLSLGVKAVGLGRPFMYANVFGVDGVKKVIDILKHEIAIDAGNLGVPDVQKINPSYVKWQFNNWNQ